MLDLEQSLNEILHILYDHISLQHAAIYLPTLSMDYSLAAWLNKKKGQENEDFFENLTDFVVTHPSITSQDLIVDQNQLEGLNSSYGYSVFPCLAEEEVLAIFLLVYGSKPTVKQLGALIEISEIFGEHLARILRIYNRLKEWMEC